MTAVEEPKKLR